MPTLQQLESRLNEQARTIADLSRQISGLIARPGNALLRVKYGLSKTGTVATYEDAASPSGDKEWKFGEIEIYPRLPGGKIETDANKVVTATYIGLNTIEAGHPVAYWPDLSLAWYFDCSQAPDWTDP